MMQKNILKQKTNWEDIEKRAIAGSFITTKHPNFPYLINEIEYQE